MVKRFKKFQTGEGSQYVSRLSALHKLQLSLNDFRRLCILKGIYPREPKNRKRAQRGDTSIKILYHKKDINFLLNEPLVWTLRDMKIQNRRIKFADAVKDTSLKRMRLAKYPEIKLDHVVRERYPTFIDAIKDLDDCLTLLFLFSTFPALKAVSRTQTALCRRLTIEFMHYIISSNALRKVFVSIKGYYFQAEVKGEMVTWIVPHYYPFQPQAKKEVDFRIMATFVEFYTIMSGFVNFRLYHSVNLQYPPQFSNVSLDSDASQQSEDVFVSERIAALNVDLMKTNTEPEETEEDQMDLQLISNEGDSDKVRKMQERENSLKRLKTLFKGLKFFINREVPREPLVFIIKCFGGKVSWDKSCFVGSTFDETDETITHQICDRPSIENKYISRDYIQPQWVFDSVNQSKLLATNKYFLGVTLPPHLSPFVNPDREENEYIPPEERALRDPNLIVTHVEDVHEHEEAQKTDMERDNDLLKAFKAERIENHNAQHPRLDDSESEVDMTDMLNDSEDEEESEENLEKSEIKQKKKPVEPVDPKVSKQRKRDAEKEKMKVTTGKIEKVDNKKAKRLNEQDLKLRAKMVKSRHKKLYFKLLEKREKETKEAKLLDQKRKRFENKSKELKDKAAKAQ